MTVAEAIAVIGEIFRTDSHGKAAKELIKNFEG
jgi:thiamine monophosphate synthase